MIVLTREGIIKTQFMVVIQNWGVDNDNNVD